MYTLSSVSAIFLWHTSFEESINLTTNFFLGSTCFKEIVRHSNQIIRRPGSACTVFFSYVASKFCHKIQNPKSPNIKIQNPKSPKSKIQNPKSPRSKIQNPPNPQNPQNPKSCAKIQNLGRWGPHISPKFGALGTSHKDLLHNGPKSKIQNPPNPKSKI